MTKIALSESRILYGLSMQAVYGDVNQEEPSKFDIIEWNNGTAGGNTEECQKRKLRRNF